MFERMHGGAGGLYMKIVKPLGRVVNAKHAEQYVNLFKLLTSKVLKPRRSDFISNVRIYLSNVYTVPAAYYQGLRIFRL